MGWWLKVLVLTALVFSLGMAYQAIRSRMARQTIGRWGGEGVRDDLAPAEAALLLGLHPGAVIYLWLRILLDAGRAEILSLAPVRVGFAEGPPRDELEAALRAATDEEGGLQEEGAVSFLEALYRDVDRKLIDHSGRETVVRYRDLVVELWREQEEREDPAPEARPWLLLADAREVWERSGPGDGWASVLAAFREKNLFVQGLFTEETLVRKAREAGEGYFAWAGVWGKELEDSRFSADLMDSWWQPGK